MNILERIKEHAVNSPDRIALCCGQEKLSYGKLWDYSERLAVWLGTEAGDDRSPVAVYGHKHPWMIVCFLACVKSGRAYCPIDLSVPDARVNLILQTLPSKLVLTTEPLQADGGNKRIISREELKSVFESPGNDQVSETENWVSGEATYYIIFTSGSTGNPKGVQITADCLNHYLDWSVNLGGKPEEKQGRVFLNQAPFSFDLSVMDLYTCLALGGTLYCLEKSVQSDYRLLMDSLKESDACVWVSTPSFADICLSEPSFDSRLMPQLKNFLFCGETLGNRTARKLQQRFPDACIVNTYGPTESTVAVTEVTVTPELEQTENPLPVGKAKPGTRIEIRDEEGKVLPEGEKGEIIILGNTVSSGYFGRKDLTEKSFFVKKIHEDDPDEHSGKTQEYSVRGYRTGDRGFLKNGMLYYCGRIDLQVKLHGYRIELEDIENNLCRLPCVEQAVVLPNSRGGKVSSLTAYIVERKAGNVPESVLEKRELSDIPYENPETAKAIREELKQFLPDYMIPKKILFLDQMPVTNNGKADRKRLGGQKA